MKKEKNLKDEKIVKKDNVLKENLCSINRNAKTINSAMKWMSKKSVWEENLCSINRNAKTINSAMKWMSKKSVWEENLCSINRNVKTINSAMKWMSKKSVWEENLCSINRNAKTINSAMKWMSKKSVWEENFCPINNNAKTVNSAMKLMGKKSVWKEVLYSTNENSKLMSSVIEQTKEQIQCINFNNIQINNNDTLKYANEIIDIDNTIDEINSCLEEDISIEDRIQNINEQVGRNNPIISVILFILIIIPTINFFRQSSNFIEKDTFINYEISKGINNLNESFIYLLDNIADIMLFVLMYTSKKINEINEFAKEQPASFSLILELLGFMIRGIYTFIRNKYDKIEISEEILKDNKRKIKFIKKHIMGSFKNEFKNKIIINMLETNFGVVNCNNIDVRINNTIKAPIIYTFKKTGDMVMILDKRKNWIKIKFDGQDDKTYIGWTFTRYIDKFN